MTTREQELESALATEKAAREAAVKHWSDQYCAAMEMYEETVDSLHAAELDLDSERTAHEATRAELEALKQRTSTWEQGIRNWEQKAREARLENVALRAKVERGKL